MEITAFYVVGGRKMPTTAYCFLGNTCQVGKLAKVENVILKLCL